MFNLFARKETISGTVVESDVRLAINSNRQNPQRCCILAHSLKRVTGDIWWVLDRQAERWVNQARTTYALNSDARKVMISFDDMMDDVVTVEKVVQTLTGRSFSVSRRA
jgi:hypothetical protein